MAFRTNFSKITWAIPALFAIGLYAGCGGREQIDVAGTGAEAGAGGSGASTGTGGGAGTGAQAGAGGANVDAAVTNDGSAGTNPGPDGAVEDSWPNTDAPSPEASCLIYNDACDVNNDQCCGPMACRQGPNGQASCRAPLDAGPDGETCAGNHGACDQGQTCCVGLECADSPQGLRCSMPAPDAGQCIANYQDCSAPGAICCQGLTCGNTPMGQRCTQGGTTTDGGTSCTGQWQTCDNTAPNCCAGLSCQQIGPVYLCR